MLQSNQNTKLKNNTNQQPITSLQRHAFAFAVFMFAVISIVFYFAFSETGFAFAISVHLFSVLTLSYAICLLRFRHLLLNLLRVSLFLLALISFLFNGGNHELFLVTDIIAAEGGAGLFLCDRFGPQNRLF